MSTTIKEIRAPLFAIIIGMFMVLLNMTAMNVAIPKLMNTFQSPLSLMQWATTGYILAEAAIIPVAGWLADRFGGRRMFILAISIFTICSILCALSINAEQFILFRILQGLGGGIVMPIGYAIVFRISPPDKIGTVMGSYLGVPILIAPAIGPVFAGWLVDYVSWPYLFWVNVPVGILGICLGLRYLPKLESQAQAKLDKLGMIFGPLAFAALIYGVHQGGDAGWDSMQTIIGLAVGVVALLLFILVELRSSEPLLELRVFRSWSFTSAMLILWLTAVTFYGNFFLIPVYLQQVKGFNAFDTGLLMIPQAIACIVLMQIGGRLFDRMSVKPLVIIGTALLGLGAFLLSRVSSGSGMGMLIVAMTLAGSGHALYGMSLNAFVMKSAPQALINRVTSLNNASQQVMGSFAVAAFSTLLTARVSASSRAIPQVEIWADAFSFTFLVVTAVSIVGVVMGLLIRKPTALTDEAIDQPDARGLDS
ncbi:MDR family MFS transporter [Paenibacillus glucanolyticus]|nr:MULTISPECIES: MDR family MFS transporter [Paenibacillus]AWP27292.1 MFS transporter [Paenibacillus sp. Cedars]MDH6670693.1 EmrB/QacA subfamily drug resistance transporter [Paenibacillus sp. LBL]MPY17801.1 multidrug efflux MFS transporter [Paenibacillus glucanolyticus]